MRDPDSSFITCICWFTFSLRVIVAAHDCCCSVVILKLTGARRGNFLEVKQLISRQRNVSKAVEMSDETF